MFGLNWKRSEAQRPDNQTEQFAFVIVPGNAVHVDGMARLALMNQQPLAIRSSAYGDWLHAAATVRGAVTRRIIEVDAPKAPGTVIAMAGPRSVERKFAGTVSTFQIFRAGVRRHYMLQRVIFA